MTLKLAAPFPAIEVYSYYPEPEYGDSERLTSEVSVLRTLTNQIHTFVKSKANRRRIQFRLNLSRSKAAELKEFITHYYDKEIEVTDSANVRWRAYFMSNPFEFESTGIRTENTGLSYRTITLDFEGVQL